MANERFFAWGRKKSKGEGKSGKLKPVQETKRTGQPLLQIKQYHETGPATHVLDPSTMKFFRQEGVLYYGTTDNYVQLGMPTIFDFIQTTKNNLKTLEITTIRYSPDRTQVKIELNLSLAIRIKTQYHELL